MSAIEPLSGTRAAAGHADPGRLIAKALYSRNTAFVLLAIALLQQSLGHHNGDNSWLFTVAERLLSGARPYADVLETNPPGAFLIYMPAAWVARLMGLPIELVASTTIFLGTLGLLVHLRSGLLRSDVLAPSDSHFFLNAGVFALLVLPGFSFGEREHLASIAVLPMLCLYGRRAAGDRPSLSEIALAGLLAGLAVIAKPHFAAAIALPLMWLAVQQRSMRPLFAVEHWIAAAPVVIYLASLPLVFPAFFDRLPSIVEVYVPIRTPFSLLLTKPWFLVNLTLIGTVILAGRRFGIPALARFCLLGSAGFALAYVVQAKGWVNHGLPGVSLAFLAAAITVGPALREFLDVGPESQLWQAQRRPLLFVLLPALISAPILFGTIIQFSGWEEYEGLTSAVRRLGPPHPKLAAVSAELDVGHPLVRRVEGVWSMRPHSLWQMTCALMLLQRGNAGPELTQRLKAYVDEDAHNFREDMERNQPDLIIVDGSGAIGQVLRNPDVVAGLKDYRPIESVAHLMIWKRSH